MRDDVTETAMLVQLERLAVAFGKPFGLQAKRMGQEYAGAFRRAGLPGMTLERAVDEAIGTGKRFPSASDLLERARTYLPKTDGERQTNGDPEVCAFCGTRSFYAGCSTPSGVILPRLRCACPLPDPMWYTEAALAWSEPEPDKHQGRMKPRDYPSARYKERQTTAKVQGGFRRAIPTQESQ